MKMKNLFLAMITFALLLTGCEKTITVTGISIDPDKVTLTEIGGKATVTVKLAPEGAEGDVVWTSSDPAVVTVEGNGLSAVITAVGKGNANITATVDIFKAVSAVTVNINAETGGEGNGSKDSPYNVAQVIKFFDGATLPKDIWAQGYIVAGVTENADVTAISSPEHVIFGTNGIRATAVLIADSKDETDYTKCVIINLPTGNIRTAINLKDNPGNLKKTVAVHGNVARYFAIPGVRDLTDFKLEGQGTTPQGSFTTKFLDEPLTTQASYDKFTAVSVKGDEKWTFSSKYGAMMSGFADNASHENEDWFISPAINLAGQSGVGVLFDHARGPAGSINVGITEGWYKVYATANYTGNVATTTWVEVTGINHGTAAWGFVSSGVASIPAGAISGTTRIALKYLCNNTESATWEVKNLVVGK
jgi:hypothetical protein